MCISIKTDKKELLFELKRKNCHIIDYRKFLKTVKPMLSNKFVNSEKITLIDNEKIITNDKEIAKVLHDFFSNIIKILNMPKKNHTDSIIEVRNSRVTKSCYKIELLTWKFL